MKKIYYSKQRELILDYITRCKKAPSGDEIFYALREELSEVSRSTVFRNLNFLVENKKITRLATPKGPARYELANNSLHAICEICGKSISFNIQSYLEKDIEDLLKDVYNKTNIRTTMKGINFLGICNQCEKNLKRKKRYE
jgi:Fur family ferric uptake transcriptional regulator